MLMAATAALRSLAQNHVRVPRKHEWAAIDCEHAIANKVKKNRQEHWRLFSMRRRNVYAAFF